MDGKPYPMFFGDDPQGLTADRLLLNIDDNVLLR
jgi:hypothetical protein